MEQTPQVQEYQRSCARKMDRIRRENENIRKQQPNYQHGNINASEAASVLPRKLSTISEYINTYGLSDWFADGTSCNPHMGYRRYLHRKINWGVPNHRPRCAMDDREVHWGNRFEKIAIRIYESMEGKSVEHFHAKVHRKYRFLCAKPDGISCPDVDLLEVKCPYRRGISQVPPLPYWIQAQIQMEVFDIGHTDFFQCKFRTYRNESEFLNGEIRLGQDKGVGVQTSPDDIVPSPDGLTVAEAIEWAKREVEMQHPDERLKIVFWKLEDATLIKIKRDSQWFEKNKLAFYRAHLDIQGYPPDFNIIPSLPAMPILSSFRTAERLQLNNFIPTCEDICGESSDEMVYN